MGVLGSYCCLCALPLQHDHLVHGQETPTIETSPLKIYRGSLPGGGHKWRTGEPPFAFGPQHAWLAQVVGLARFDDRPELLMGTVLDGKLSDAEGTHSVSIYTGCHDYVAFHRVCWQMMGAPRTASAALYSVVDEEWRTERSIGTYDWALLASYHEQLFDFAGLVRDGYAWMLADPMGTSPASAHSRARIEAALRTARRRNALPQRASLATVPQVLRADCDWYAHASSDVSGNRIQVVRTRQAVRPDLDRTGYDELLWMMTEYDDTEVLSHTDLEAALQLELAIKRTIERDHRGILVASLVTRNRAQYVLQTRDGAEAWQRIEALPQARLPTHAEYELEVDPSWYSTFELLLV